MNRKTSIPSLIAARVSNLRRPPRPADSAPPSDTSSASDQGSPEDVASENGRAAERAATDLAFIEATGSITRLDVLRETANQHSAIRKPVR